MEDNLQLSVPKKSAREIYKSADATMKLILEASAPTGFFSGKITDRVKTVLDACNEVGVAYEDLLPYPIPKNKREEGINAFAVISVIHEALCEGWEADWSNHSQQKHYPWFINREGSGLGLSFAYDSYFYYTTAVGSRLVFPTSELAIYAGKQFLTEYNKFLIK